MTCNSTHPEGLWVKKNQLHIHPWVLPRLKLGMLIEWEMLAVVFSFMKFHHYLYGQEFTCHSDHKSHADIHLRHLSDAPARFLLNIQPYDFVIKYGPIMKIPMDDALGRCSPQVKDENEMSPSINSIQTWPKYMYSKSRRQSKETRYSSSSFNRYWKVGLNTAGVYP